MIINNLDIFRYSIPPAEADSPLIINENAVLTGTVAFECLKVIPGWNPQILQAISDFELPEFSPGNFGDIRKPPDTLAFGKRPGGFTSE
jgi:hypothetical protein